MRLIPVLLGLVAACFLQAEQTAPIRLDERFEQLLLQIEEVSDYSPQLAWPFAGEALELIESELESSN